MEEEIKLKSKQLKYKGQNLEYLQSLDVRQCAKYLPASARRSILRRFEVIEKFVKDCERKMAKNKKIRTHMRHLVIVPKMVGMSIGVHNGKSFEQVQITSDMIGHRLGEFSITTKRVTHSAAGIGATKGSKAAKK